MQQAAIVPEYGIARLPLMVVYPGRLAPIESSILITTLLP